MPRQIWLDSHGPTMELLLSILLADMVLDIRRAAGGSDTPSDDAVYIITHNYVIKSTYLEII